MKALKIVFGALLALSLVLVLGIAAIMLLVDPNDYKKELEKLAADQGAELHIEGDLGWSFYPSLGIDAGKLTVKPPMDNLVDPISFDRLRVGLQILPLLKREIRTSKVQVSGGELRLRTVGSDEMTHIQQLQLTADGFNLQQQPVDLQLALEMSSERDGEILQHIELSSVFKLSVDSLIKNIIISSSTHTIRYTGASIPQPANVSADFSGHIDLEKALIELKSLTLAIDDAHLVGDIKASYGEKPFYQIKLKGDSINVDRYTKPISAPSDGEVSATAGKQDPVIPVATVLAFPGDYDISFQKLVIQHMTLTDMHLAMSVSPEGLINIKPFKTHLYEGDFNLEGRVDLRSAQPRAQLGISLSPLQLEPAMKDFLQVEKTFASGDFSFKADVSTQGLTTEDFIRMLDGNFSFASQSMTLNKMDLTSSLDASLLQLLQMKLPTIMSGDNQTVLTQLIGEGSIKQGLVKPTFTAHALCTQFNGDGTYDLPKSGIDYHVGITFPSTDENKTCTDINSRLKDIAWPVVCKGSMADDPAKLCRADKDKMQSMLAKAVKKETGQKLEKKLDEQLKKKLGESEEADQVKSLLKGLLN